MCLVIGPILMFVGLLMAGITFLFESGFINYLRNRCRWTAPHIGDEDTREYWRLRRERERRERADAA